VTDEGLITRPVAGSPTPPLMRTSFFLARVLAEKAHEDSDLDLLVIEPDFDRRTTSTSGSARSSAGSKSPST
jgi:hypothetical protein